MHPCVSKVVRELVSVINIKIIFTENTIFFHHYLDRSSFPRHHLMQIFCVLLKVAEKMFGGSIPIKTYNTLFGQSGELKFTDKAI